MRPTKHVVYSSRTADKFVVRLPDGMRERIAVVARNHHRSMNSEIIARLEASLIVDEGAAGKEVEVNHASTPRQARAVIEPWNPTIGRAVEWREGPLEGQKGVIVDISFRSGEMQLVVKSASGMTRENPTDLKPALVK